MFLFKEQARHLRASTMAEVEVAVVKDLSDITGRIIKQIEVCVILF